MKPIAKDVIDKVLADKDIVDIGKATIRQCVNVAQELEQISGEKFMHLEFGIPGLDACEVGIQAQKMALDEGVASAYPPASGVETLKQWGSKFIKAFINADVKAEGIIPTVGSMQGCYNLLLECSQLKKGKNVILYFNPGFPSHYLQAKVLGLESRSFDMHDFRGEKLRGKLEEMLSDGRVCALLYSNPNNPSWCCLSDDELRIVGEMCEKHDVIALEDMAYLCMDFRKDLSHPFRAPFQPTVAHYTDNYVMMISASKIFSYAGERVAIVAISDKLFHRFYPDLQERYGIGKFGDNFCLTYLYVNSSGCSHSAQCALASMFKASLEGKYDFVGTVKEYGMRARRAKDIFMKHHFHLVYEKDQDGEIGDGFFFTVAYDDLNCTSLILNMMRCGISTITLTSARSESVGLRVCMSMLNSEADFQTLDDRLATFEGVMEREYHDEYIRAIL
ncbi:MAG: pyridoxal phosphate-dependent aminotransferase [Bacteroidales bacterium]|jgi:aspartate/methionine/tyrosine aminotransferase|nr:pyridoxal phosphate-dependent aminotransferase [Bacteroidales bacterium]